MLNLHKIRGILQPTLFTKYSLKLASKTVVELSSELQKQLENEETKPKKHPGIIQSGHLVLPITIQKSIMRTVGDYPLKNLLKDGELLSRYMKSRHPPAEKEQIHKKVSDINAELETQFPALPTVELNEVELENYKKIRDGKIQKILKERVFAWKPLSYDKYQALCYMFGRSSQEYGILLKIFKEIQMRDVSFKPFSYFDFGSGIGTGMWAASALWKESIFEYFNVDLSREMNELSELILRQGSENHEMSLKNVFYRQFLPASHNDYDLIVSAFSLFELSSSNSRKEVLSNLWRKCNGYLIIVEEGTRHGFELINEAKDYLLSKNNSNLENKGRKGYVFSPCPHDLPCPRFANLNDKTPCNFEISYEPIGEKSKKSKHLYSYVVLKKGVKSDAENENWPRIVRPTLVRSKHTVCRMCTKEGNLKEIIFTASKQGKLAYKCARSSRWGDRLPIKIFDEKTEKNLE